ncbi:MAG: hypothetical protein U0531_15195 [Dehalococcoidia bacterium]
MNTGIITLWLPADSALVNEELDLDLTTTTPEDLIHLAAGHGAHPAGGAAARPRVQPGARRASTAAVHAAGGAERRAT